MRLLAHIEEIDKKKWKVSFDPRIQGNWGKTVKLTNKNKEFPQTKFNKEMPMDSQIGHVIAEIFARSIIEKVNKAFRMFGYKTDLMSIPAEIDWFLGWDHGPTINLTTSAFNKATMAVVGGQKQRIKFNALRTKNEILNLLIGNQDTHTGNFIFHKSSQKNYAIDFGLAMQWSSIPEFDFAGQIKVLYSKKNNRTKKYLRIQKYLVFWQGFLENNIDNFDNWLWEETSKFLKEFTSQTKKFEKEYKEEDIDIEKYKEDVLQSYNYSVALLQSNAQDILKQINEELKIINNELKNA